MVLEWLNTHKHTSQCVSVCVIPDVDECVDDPELCSPHGECLNTEGSYLCVCGSGFVGNLDTPSCDGKMQPHRKLNTHKNLNSKSQHHL